MFVRVCMCSRVRVCVRACVYPGGSPAAACSHDGVWAMPLRDIEGDFARFKHALAPSGTSLPGQHWFHMPTESVTDGADK